MLQVHQTLSIGHKVIWFSGWTTKALQPSPWRPCLTSKGFHAPTPPRVKKTPATEVEETPPVSEDAATEVEEMLGLCSR